MKRKLLVRYGILCLPFVCGFLLYGIGVYNLISSLLFFVGGYIAVKNLVDYRKINNNIRLVNSNDKTYDSCLDNSFKNEDSKNIDNYYSKTNNYRSYDSIPGLKRTRRYVKVRRRIK